MARENIGGESQRCNGFGSSSYGIAGDVNLEARQGVQGCLRYTDMRFYAGEDQRVASRLSSE